MDTTDGLVKGGENGLRPFLLRNGRSSAPLLQARHRAAVSSAQSMKLPTWARLLSAVFFLLSGLAETLGATGLVIQVAPAAIWGPATHTIAVGGLMQITSAALLALGRKTRWALMSLLVYVTLGSIFGNLPRVLSSSVDGSAIAGLAVNLVSMAGLLCWLRFERTPGGTS